MHIFSLPTDPFTILKPCDRKIGELCIGQVRRATVFELNIFESVGRVTELLLLNGRLSDTIYEDILVIISSSSSGG